jgi:uncharacterized membrane protein YgdD (TMEM256/DUF423 family)
MYWLGLYLAFGVILFSGDVIFSSLWPDRRLLVVRLVFGLIACALVLWLGNIAKVGA